MPRGLPAAFARHDPESLARGLDILKTAAAGWKARGKPFFVLWRGQEPAGPEAIGIL